MVYQGLLWVGALQVDPGWTSYLPCPLYNLSDREVTIRFKEKLFTIDFVRTTPVTSDSIRYEMPFEVHPPLNQFSVGLKSGPYQQLDELRKVRDEVSAIRGQGYLLLTIVGRTCFRVNSSCCAAVCRAGWPSFGWLATNCFSWC